MASNPARSREQIFLCEHLHQPGGWLSPGVIRVDADGVIVSVGPGSAPRDAEAPVKPERSGRREDAAQARGQVADTPARAPAGARDGDGDPDAGADTVRLSGFVIPGVANVHSHAFQRALVGLAEHARGAQPGSGPASGAVMGGDRAGGEDTFWTWREEMYGLALAIEPEQLEAIAAQLYVEMLEAGMTAVGEFHYLHHDRGGAPYRDRGELSRRVVAAAQTAGIGLTHLPVLYMRGGFDAGPGERQRRFVHGSVDAFWATVDAVRLPDSACGLFRLGIAPHSLRAVGGGALREVVDELRRRDARAPVHIHIAEQAAEVEQALRHLGRRPIRWLVESCAVDDRWCLVHATHAEPDELVAVAGSRAVVGLCPSTEANLGDGVFPLADFARAGGRFAIGSDSHVTVDPAEELRALEYVQRLLSGRRNVLCEPSLSGWRTSRASRQGGRADVDRHVGRYLLDRAARWGARALDQPIGALAPGSRADLVVLDADHPRLCGHGPDTVVDAWIFGAARAPSPIRHVFVAGQQRVRDGAHVAREPVAAAFRAAIASLRSRA